MRWLVRLFLTFAVLALLLVGAVFLIPGDHLARLAAERLAAATGRDVTITGDLRPTIWPVIGVRTGPISIGNADWAADRPLLQAEALEIGLDFAALWRGEIAIRRLAIEKPDIALERDAAGRGNWEIAAAQPAPAPAEQSAAARPLTLDQGSLRNGRLSFRDHGSGAVFGLEAIDLDLALPQAGQAAQLDLSALFNGQVLTLRGRINEAPLFLNGTVTAVDLAGGFAGADFAFAGRAGLTGVAEGRLRLDAPDPARLLRALGQSPDLLPPGRLAVAGDANLTEQGSFHLRNGTVTAAGNDLRVAGDLVPGVQRPRLTAQVSTDVLRIGEPPAGSAIAAPTGTAPAQTGWSTAPIDVSALHLADADISFTANGIEAAGLRLGATQVALTLDAARAVFDLREVRAFDGNLTGEFVINGRSGLSVGGTLRAEEIGMQPLLIWLAGQDRLISRAGGEIRFLGVGNSVAAIMNSLSGEGHLQLGRGEIVGLDLLGMLRRLDPNYVGEGARTIFDRIAGSFTIRDGVLQNNDLVFDTPLLTATGAGQIGLGTRTLSYRLVPTALTAEDGTGGVRVPFLVSGPWASPSIRLDLEGLAAERLERERRALEERAAAEARRALDRLGIEQREGEDLEDAARRTVEEEARRVLEREIQRGLGRLLGQQ